MRKTAFGIGTALLTALLGTGCKVVVTGADTYETCSSSSDCGNTADQCFAIPYGSATRYACTRPCSYDSDCPYAGRCLSFDGGATYQCVESCSTSATCEPGWSCQTVDVGGAACLPGGGGGTVGTYGTCGTSADCLVGSCVSFAAGAASICTGTCAADTDCPTGGRCLSQDGGLSYYCIQTCFGETCPGGWSCQNVDARGSACLPGSPGIPAYDECVTGGTPCAAGLGCSTIIVDGASASMCTMHGCGPANPCPLDIDGMRGECMSFDGGRIYTCFEPCTVAADCAPGWTCKSQTADGTRFPPICLPM